MEEEQEQKFIIMECKICSDNGGKWTDGKRRFVTHVKDPDTIICTNCGFTTQLNKQEDTKCKRH